MQDLQIDWLRAFVAVVDAGSITAAARQVSRSQSAVSMQLMKLEDCVGRPLLNRSPRHLSLTPTGIELLSHARQLVELHGRAQRAMQGSTISGRVAIGAPDEYVKAYLAGVLRRMATHFADVQITLVCEASSTLLPKIDRGDLDLALVTRDTATRGGTTRGHFLFHEDLVWAAHEAHEAWRRDPLPLAVHDLGHRFRNEVLASIRAHGRQCRVLYGSPNVAGQVALVDAGLAVGVFSRCSVPAHIRLLDGRHDLPRLPRMEVALVRSRESRRAPAADAIHAEIVEELEARD